MLPKNFHYLLSSGKPILFIRIISASLVFSLVPGCASTRLIQFQSEPPGATVQISGSTCETPCSIELSNEEQSGVISLPSGQKKIITIEAMPGITTRAGYGITRSGAITLELLSVPLLAYGLVGAVLMSGNETDSFRNEGYEAGDTFSYVTMGSLIAGGILLYTGYGLEKASDSMKPAGESVYVDFSESEEKPSDNPGHSMTIDEFIRSGVSFRGTKPKIKQKNTLLSPENAPTRETLR